MEVPDFNNTLKTFVEFLQYTRFCLFFAYAISSSHYTQLETETQATCLNSQRRHSPFLGTASLPSVIVEMGSHYSVPWCGEL